MSLKKILYQVKLAIVSFMFPQSQSDELYDPLYETLEACIDIFIFGDPMKSGADILEFT
jgi:hypothetical protein